MNFKPSGNPKVLELTKSCRDRSINLDNIKTIKLDELNTKGRSKALCAWCAEVEILKSNQKYCSRLCSESATAWARPQKEDALRFLLVRQDWKCSGCQFDYRPVIQFIVNSEKKRRPNTPDLRLESLHWYYMKRLKNKCPDERRPEVDHIMPVYKGGETLGLGNHQVLCYSCHKTKTKSDISGKRKKDLTIK